MKSVIPRLLSPVHDKYDASQNISNNGENYRPFYQEPCDSNVTQNPLLTIFNDNCNTNRRHSSEQLENKEPLILSNLYEVCSEHFNAGLKDKGAMRTTDNANDGVDASNNVDIVIFLDKTSGEIKIGVVNKEEFESDSNENSNNIILASSFDTKIVNQHDAIINENKSKNENKILSNQTAKTEEKEKIVTGNEDYKYNNKKVFGEEPEGPDASKHNHINKQCVSYSFAHHAAPHSSSHESLRGHRVAPRCYNKSEQATSFNKSYSTNNDRVSDRYRPYYRNVFNKAPLHLNTPEHAITNEEIARQCQELIMNNNRNSNKFTRVNQSKSELMYTDNKKVQERRVISHVELKSQTAEKKIRILRKGHEHECLFDKPSSKFELKGNKITGDTVTTGKIKTEGLLHTKPANQKNKTNAVHDFLNKDSKACPDNKTNTEFRTQISKSKVSLNKCESKAHPLNINLEVCIKTADANVTSPQMFDNNARLKRPRRKRANKNQKNKLPKSRITIFQRYIETGQLRSKLSHYKTEGLKNIKLIEELHAGTFSTKYKASFRNKQVVLTVYYDQDLSDIDALEMAHLGNSYFVASYNDCMSGPYSSLWFLAHYYTLGDLRKLLSRDPHRLVFGELHSQFISAGVLLGVDFLHNRGIIHGNIKPSKVLLNNLGYPVLTGFLKVNEDPDKERRDVFTPAYAAPKRFHGSRDPAVDIFSVGCMAYEIITGCTPFDGGSLEETKENILDRDWILLFEPELFSFAGEKFIYRCLSKNGQEQFKIGENRKNLFSEEWFSTFSWREMKRQTLRSPVLDAIQLIDKCATLNIYEKAVHFQWGMVMDVTCPDGATLDDYVQ